MFNDYNIVPLVFLQHSTKAHPILFYVGKSLFKAVLESSS